MGYDAYTEAALSSPSDGRRESQGWGPGHGRRAGRDLLVLLRATFYLWVTVSYTVYGFLFLYIWFIGFFTVRFRLLFFSLGD